MTEWKEWGNHVLHELNRLSDAQQDQNDKLEKIHMDLIQLQTKATVWGTVAGFTVSLVVQIAFFIFKKS